MDILLLDVSRLPDAKLENLWGFCRIMYKMIILFIAFKCWWCWVLFKTTTTKSPTTVIFTISIPVNQIVFAVPATALLRQGGCNEAFQFVCIGTKHWLSEVEMSSAAFTFIMNMIKECICKSVHFK